MLSQRHCLWLKGISNFRYDTGFVSRGNAICLHEHNFYGVKEAIKREGILMRRRASVLFAATALLVGIFAFPAQATIHEIVSSHCAGHDLPNNAAHVNPPGQSQFGTQSFLRALLATGVYESVDEGEDPWGNLDPLFVTIHIDGDHPANKFSVSEGDWVSFVDPITGVTVFFEDLTPDHPSLSACLGLDEGGHD